MFASFAAVSNALTCPSVPPADRIGVDLEEVPGQADPARAELDDAVVAGGHHDMPTGGDVDAVRRATTAVVAPLDVVRIDTGRVVVVVLRGADAVQQLGVDDPPRRVEDHVGRELARAKRAARAEAGRVM